MHEKCATFDSIECGVVVHVESVFLVVVYMWQNCGKVYTYSHYFARPIALVALANVHASTHNDMQRVQQVYCNITIVEHLKIEPITCECHFILKHIITIFL